MNAIPQHVDVLIVGGGPAGLTAATALGRSRRSVLVIDAGQPRNAPAAHAHNILSRDGASPHEVLSLGRREVESYGGRILNARAENAAAIPGGFRVTTDADDTFTARRLILATGLVDTLPELPGIAERWGRDVLHCPYCHGWEVRDRVIGVLATGPTAVHQALLFRQLSDRVTVFRHTAPEFTAEEAEMLAALGIRLVSGTAESLVVTDDALSGLRLTDGRVEAVDALVVGPRYAARTALAAGLGLTGTEHPMGSRIDSDGFGATTVPGVWVAGNVTDLAAQVMTSASGGLLAAIAVNNDLIQEDAAAAVTARRAAPARVHDQAAQISPAKHDRAFWDERYAATDSVWSGRPNAQLVVETAALAPGRALDVGCGEGADALWLAEQGWAVTAVDISAVALRRAAEVTGRRHPAVAERVSWEQRDLLEWVPPVGTFDLVSAQFMHLLPESRRLVYARLAEAVALGGSLLIVGHRPSARHGGHPEGFFFTADEIVADLDRSRWDVVAAETRQRTITSRDGRPEILEDAVVHARRRV
ncbi:NAD(P)/FAD-dependent oxidoreductase [Klugiella xanthotipulae]|uniref:Thioredoxin reductase n=1 Tax=Klugiella xanthotipulae TaxID=244735 RepID=A0A543I4E8_9MICO|nr:bifunctional NAD(P)/FAD-dependent oxidoreductase/class I SAM-dependent methyltransferase [Klugiella xanthotipulae]TQM65455.1 thioredoxin reductase [Klugiella xanthotipulae]